MTKMLIDRSTVEQALEALELYVPKEDYENRPVGNVIDALRGVQAEPEQEPEWEVRADGKRVHKDRWQIGIRRIVALIWGNRREFEIDEVVEAVRGLASAERTLKRLGYTDCGGEFWKPPLGAPPQRKPLTDDAMQKVFTDSFGLCPEPGGFLFRVGRAVEAAHKIGGEG